MGSDIPLFTNGELRNFEIRSSDPELLMDLVPVHSSFSDDNHIIKKVSGGECNLSGKWLKLAVLALELDKKGKIDNISTLDLLKDRFEPYPYQLKVALNVLKDKSSMSLLADEVGLGKTIEVGLVLKEHIIRDNIHSILIVTPKALMSQWQDEMLEKFNERFITSEDRDFDYSSNRIIISFGKLARNLEKLNNRQWDMVVVDEAHLLSNTRSKRRQAVASLDRRYMLLSTATPLCNRLNDIYSLVDLLYPGILGTAREFKSMFFADNAGRVIRPDMKNELKRIISKVMVRTLRKDSGIPFTERFIYSVRVKGSHEEEVLSNAALDLMRRIYLRSYRFSDSPFGGRNNSKGNVNFLMMKELISLQQSLSSSPSALRKSLENRVEKHPEEAGIILPVIDECKKVDIYSKAQTLLETLNGIPDEKAVIFTLRLETAYMLCDLLNENMMPSRVYEGKLTGYERKALLNEFRSGTLRYIVATDAAAEGLNLQNASVVVNYDLHWNPMKIEQRIGRVHRRGQEKDVHIFNLVMKDSIDDYVLSILYEKIDLFRMTVGGLEAILSEMKDDDFDMEEAIMDIIMRAGNKRDVKREREKLRENMEYKKEQSKLWQEFTQLVLD